MSHLVESVLYVVFEPCIILIVIFTIEFDIVDGILNVSVTFYVSMYFSPPSAISYIYRFILFFPIVGFILKE